ncbi:MAG: transposase [Clostridia bacterium]|jgi:hypothetical protein|nr:transposase [Clostridia bacterium]
MKDSITLDEFKKYYLDNNYNENMFNEYGSINPEYNSSKKTGVLAQIFEDHWNYVYETHRDGIDRNRPNANKEIRKIIDCHNKNLGCSVYQCPDCNDIIFVGHTCKSRICSSCGYKYKNERVENILQTAYNCKHRQIVFTIPKNLRKYFYFPFEPRMSILYKAVRNTLYSVFNESFKYNKKSKKLIKYVSKIVKTPGFFAFLHTFGRDLKWNPHIHILIAEIELCSNGLIRKHEFFDFDALSKRFQKILLDLLEKEIGPSFKIEKVNCYKNYQNGFYVYAEKKEFKSLKDGIEYVTRYCGRVPISENRITNYDGKNITFCYHAHEDESYHEITIPAEKFITILLNHLIPSQFKIIRYYGFYRKKHKLHDKMIMLISKEKRKFRKSLLKYEISILKSFKRNPYNCPKCDVKMNFIVEVT